MRLFLGKFKHHHFVLHRPSNQRVVEGVQTILDHRVAEAKLALTSILAKPEEA